MLQFPSTISSLRLTITRLHSPTSNTQITSFQHCHCLSSTNSRGTEWEDLLFQHPYPSIPIIDHTQYPDLTTQKPLLPSNSISSPELSPYDRENGWWIWTRGCRLALYRSRGGRHLPTHEIWRYLSAHLNLRVSELTQGMFVKWVYRVGELPGQGNLFPVLQLVLPSEKRSLQ